MNVRFTFRKLAIILVGLLLLSLICGLTPFYLQYRAVSDLASYRIVVGYGRSPGLELAKELVGPLREDAPLYRTARRLFGDMACSTVRELLFYDSPSEAALDAASRVGPVEGITIDYFLPGGQVVPGSRFPSGGDAPPGGDVMRIQSRLAPTVLTIVLMGPHLPKDKIEIGSVRYLACSGVQGDDVLNSIQLRSPPAVLEIGCGTVSATALTQPELIAGLRGLVISAVNIHGIEEINWPMSFPTLSLLSIQIMDLGKDTIAAISTLPQLECLEIRDGDFDAGSLEPLVNHPKLRRLILPKGAFSKIKVDEVRAMFPKSNVEIR